MGHVIQKTLHHVQAHERAGVGTLFVGEVLNYHCKL